MRCQSVPPCPRASCFGADGRTRSPIQGGATMNPLKPRPNPLLSLLVSGAPQRPPLLSNGPGAVGTNPGAPQRQPDVLDRFLQGLKRQRMEEDMRFAEA